MTRDPGRWTAARTAGCPRHPQNADIPPGATRRENKEVQAAEQALATGGANPGVTVPSSASVFGFNSARL